jgi:hypothetical protein
MKIGSLVFIRVGDFKNTVGLIVSEQNPDLPINHIIKFYTVLTGDRQLYFLASELEEVDENWRSSRNL